MQIELWDCSGDQKYESCWPAIMKDLHGIAVVFDPTSKAQANDVRIWCVSHPQLPALAPHPDVVAPAILRRCEYFCKAASLQNGQVRLKSQSIVCFVTNSCWQLLFSAPFGRTAT